MKGNVRISTGIGLEFSWDGSSSHSVTHRLKLVCKRRHFVYPPFMFRCDPSPPRLVQTVVSLSSLERCNRNSPLFRPGFPVDGPILWMPRARNQFLSSGLLVQICHFEVDHDMKNSCQTLYRVFGVTFWLVWYFSNSSCATSLSL